MSSRTVLDASLSFSAIGLRRSSAAVRSERNSWAQYIREHALSIFPARFGGEQEDRYRSFTQRGLLKVQRFGVTVMTLLFLQSSLCFARLTCDDDDEHEDAASASSTNRAFAWAASAVGFVVMWLQYGLLHFFSAERHRWARRTVQASYFVMALLFSWRFSLTAQRVVKTFAPGSDDPAAASGVNCTACTIHRGYETSNVLLLLLVHVFFGLSCRMCPRQYFALMHLTVVGYATARAVLGDQDKLWSQKYQDSIYLYFVLFMLYASLRRYDLAARAEFQRKDELEQINAAQQARLSRERELRRQQSQPPPTAEERSALEGQLELLPEPLKRARVNFNELVLGRALGSGTFGDVCLAEWRGTPCAVKRLRRSLLTTANLEALEAEIALHLSMRHPNIVSLLGCAFEPGRGEACAVLELCSRGTLEALLSAGTGVAGAGGVGGVGGVAPPKLAWSAHKLPIATGIARAMAYLHAQSPPVIHRDLKAANVLVDDGYNAKLSDFGLSREAAGGDEVMSMVGSPLFSAPELLRFERYDRQVDVWSFACLLESMTTHQRCYDGAGLLPVSRYPSLIAEGKLRPRLPASFFLAPLVERCSAPLAADRPRFDALVDLLTDTDLQQQAQLLAPGVIVRRPTEDAEPSTSNEMPPSSEREPAGIQAPRGGTTAREQSAAAASNAAAATTVRQQPPALLRKTSNAVVSLASLNTLGGAKREDGGSADDLDTGRAGQASRRLRFKALTV